MAARTRVRGVLDGVGPWDVAAAVAVAAVGQQEVWAPVGGVGWPHRTGPLGVLAAAYLAAAAALLWRRRGPLAVVGTVSVALSAYYLAFGAPDGLGALLPPVFAFYAAGRYGNP